MSELIAEARVLVTPDTTKFAALLETQVLAAAKSVTVPVTVTPVVTGGGTSGAVASQAAAASKEASAAEAAINKLAAAELVLANADTKVLTASTQAGAARTQFTAATRAAVLTQEAYRKAVASEDDDLIKLAAADRAAAKERQAFALATLRAAQATEASNRATATSRTTQEVAGAQAASQKVSASAAAAARANENLAKSADIVSVAERRAAGAGGEAAAANIRYAAAIRATAASFSAYEAALESSDLLLVKQTRDAFAASKANERLALTNLEVARTSQAESASLSKTAAAQAASFGGITKGAGSAGAALFGLRGATLAAGAPFIAGAAAAIAFGKAVNIATSFNQQLNVLKVTVGATADEMERVRSSAIALGKDLTLPGVSAGDAAQAMTEFAKAGLDVNDAIAATRGGLQLATAAQLSNADAVEVTASALNAFKLQGDQAVAVADTLANAANAAQGSISDIALGLKQASGAAAAVGVSFEDTTALLTLLAKNGLTASDAGTALRTAFVRLVNPSKKAQQILKDLNIQLRDANGNVRPEVFNEFAQAQQNLAKSTQQANAAVVFGQDAFRVIGLLGRENVDALDQTRVALDKQGTAAKVAAARNVGLAGATANLKNQLETTGLIVGELASGPLSALASQLATNVGAVNDFIAALGRIPKTVPLPSFQIGPLDTQKQGSELGAHLKGAFGIAAKQLALAPFGLQARGGAFLLEKFFPAKSDIDEQGRLVGAELRSAIEDASREAVQAANEVGPQLRAALDNAFSLANSQLLAAMAAGRKSLINSINRNKGQELGLSDVMNQILLGGGSPSQQIANLNKQFATQQSIIDKATTGLKGLTSQDKGFATLTKAVREARDKQVQINGQIDAIQSQVKADQLSRVAKAQKNASDAQTARDKADQAILDSFLPREQRLDIRDALAAESGLPKALIAAERARKRLLLSEIKTIQDDFNNTKAAAALIAQKRVQIVNLDTQIRTNIKQIFTNRQAARQAALEQIGTNLSLRTQIAEARDAGTAVIVKRLDAEIANQKKVVAAAKKAHKGVLEAILELERLRQKKRDLLNQQKQDAAADSGFNAFQFLQQTQGFAANLLGNLIPGFATGGLVGNTSAAGPRAGASMESLAETVPGVAAPKDRGVRPVQVDTTNSLLRQILAALHGRQTKPPEARQNWRTAFAELDTL